MEKWRDIPSWPCYEASDQGRVRRKSTGRIMKPYFCRAYLYVKLNCQGERKSALLHRLVLEAFKGPSTLLGRHLDDDQTNNKLLNLEYGTYQENADDRDYARGSSDLRSKLTAEQIREILYKHTIGGKSQRALAAEYAVSSALISNVVNGKRTP